MGLKLKSFLNPTSILSMALLPGGAGLFGAYKGAKADQKKAAESKLVQQQGLDSAAQEGESLEEKRRKKLSAIEAKNQKATGIASLMGNADDTLG